MSITARLGCTFLIVCVMVLGIDYAAPQPVEANPLVIGGTLTAAVLLAIAAGYTVSPSFRASCEEAGARLQDGAVLQTMIDYVIVMGFPPSMRPALWEKANDGTLLKSVIANFKAKGKWAQVQQVANGGVLFGDHMYWDVGGLWADMGFGANNVMVTPNEGGWISGANLGAVDSNHMAWPPVAGAAYITDVDVEVATRMAEDPGYWIKGHYNNMVLVGSDWYWRPWVSPATDNDLKCMLCGSVSAGMASAFSIKFYNIKEYKPGVGMVWSPNPIAYAFGPTDAGSNNWLNYHSSAECMPADPTGGADLTFPDNLIPPDTAWMDAGTYDGLGDALAFPQDPDRGVVPPYVPPTDAWHDGGDGSGTVGGTDVVPNVGVDDGLHDFSDDLTSAADALTGAGADWPAGFSHVINWLASPMVYFLNGWAALIHWLAHFYMTAVSAWASTFTANPQAVQIRYAPRVSALKVAYAGTFLGAGSVLVAALKSAATGGVSGSDTTVHFTYAPNRQMTVHLSDLLELVEPYRWWLQVLVLLALAAALLRLFKPQVTA